MEFDLLRSQVKSIIESIGAPPSTAWKIHPTKTQAVRGLAQLGREASRLGDACSSAIKAIHETAPADFDEAIQSIRLTLAVMRVFPALQYPPSQLDPRATTVEASALLDALTSLPSMEHQVLDALNMSSDASRASTLSYLGDMVASASMLALICPSEDDHTALLNVGITDHIRAIEGVVTALMSNQQRMGAAQIPSAQDLRVMEILRH